MKFERENLFPDSVLAAEQVLEDGEGSLREVQCHSKCFTAAAATALCVELLPMQGTDLQMV